MPIIEKMFRTENKNVKVRVQTQLWYPFHKPYASVWWVSGKLREESGFWIEGAAVGRPVQEWSSIYNELWVHYKNKKINKKYNFIHQLYITSVKLYKYNSGISAFFFRTNVIEGTFLHGTWLCPEAP